jgi:aerobic-type carbon monoxide dehydrogenase small subunit (CoxS/CutS family)
MNNKMTKLEVDGITVEAEDNPITLLDFLREDLNKQHVGYSCRRGLCGTCEVNVNGVLRKSCTIMVSSLEGQSVSTEK